MAKKKKKFWTQRRRTQLTLLSTFLTLIAVTFAVLPFFGITPQSVASSVTRAATVYSDASKIYIKEDVANTFGSRYVADRDEFVYCMYGISNPEQHYYYVDEIKETSYSSNETHAAHNPCVERKDLLGAIHSHPQPDDPRYISLCRLSDTDKGSFQNSSSLLTAVICGEDDFGFFEFDDLEKPIPYEIVTEGT